MTKPRGTSPFPWIVFLILVVSIIVFWVLPSQRPAPEINLNYRDAQNAPTTSQP